MTWFREGSGKPEAGRPLYFQHDGAKPHTAKANQEAYAAEGGKYGFDIRIRLQPAQKPEFNFLDLAFFRSLDSDVTTLPKTTRKDLIKAVSKAFNEYDADRMEACCRSLITSYRGNLETGGDNNFKTHRGMRKLRSQGEFDLAVGKSMFDQAQAKLKALKAEATKPKKASVGLAAVFDDSDEGADSD